MQMETFMKDLTALNEAIESTLIPADFDTIQKFLATQASMTTALNGLPAEYARAYLQVQTLKYDENNDPVDVTAEEALSVPESVISRYKQSWGNLKNTLEALKSRVQQAQITEVAPLLPNRDVIEFDAGNNVILKVFSNLTEYNSTVSIFSQDSEVYEIRDKISAAINSVAATGITIPTAFAMIINMVGAALMQADVNGESASRRISVVQIFARPNQSGTVTLFVMTRGRVFYNAVDTSSSATLANALSLATTLLTNGGTGWTESQSGMSNTPVPLTYGQLSNFTNVQFSFGPKSSTRAYAPGGNSVLSVDKVAVSIDLDDLDQALASL